jgi:hypothetical protein
MRLGLVTVALLLVTPLTAAAQGASRVRIAFGYRYVRAHSLGHNSVVTSPPNVTQLVFGAEAGITVRLSPHASLVATAGRSRSASAPLAITIGSSNPQVITGRATYSITDAMGGVEFSGAGTGPFVAFLAGISHSGSHFDGASGRASLVPSLDQGDQRVFAVRPAAGVNIVSKSRRLGVRLEGGFDILPRVDNYETVGPDTLWHFRAAASATIGIGAPMPAQTRPSSPRPVYFALGAGIEIKDASAFRNPAGFHARPVGFVLLGKEISRRVAVEAVVQAERAESVDWQWTYLFAPPFTQDRATHRDTLLLGRVRLLSVCATRVCFEPFAGAGFVAHRAIDEIVGDCGDSSHFKNPCEPVTPRPGAAEWQWGLAANGGAALRINLSSTVALSPMAQLSYFRHDESLFRDNFRGPASGKRWAPLFGVAVTIRP